tara:strand:+ start:182 stop:682 length:501 start_codon:yes stop_codon:yes gene_type:complete
MDVLIIKNKEYEILEEKTTSKYRKAYRLRDLDDDKLYSLLIEDYREADFVIDGKLTSTINKIGTSPLYSIKHPENIGFKTIKSKKKLPKIFRIFNSSGSVSRKRHFLKTVTWRIVGTLDTILLSYIITGSVKIGFTIGSVELFTKMFLYYLHERLWFRFSRYGIKK